MGKGCDGKGSGGEGSDCGGGDGGSGGGQGVGQQHDERGSSGGLFSSSGGGGEEEEAVRLGWLLTKLFIYLKMRAGTGTAGRFLSGVDQLRQSPTAAFFGGGGLDELAESHLEQAFKSSFTSTLKKKVSPEEIYGKLRDGHKDISDYESATNEGLDFLEEKGLGELPALLVNGVLSPLTMNYEQEIMQALSMEHRAVTGLIHKRKLTDDMKDLPYEIAKAGSAFPDTPGCFYLRTIGPALRVRTIRSQNMSLGWRRLQGTMARVWHGCVGGGKARLQQSERRAAKARRGRRHGKWYDGTRPPRPRTLHTLLPLLLSAFWLQAGICMAMICLLMRRKMKRRRRRRVEGQVRRMRHHLLCCTVSATCLHSMYAVQSILLSRPVHLRLSRRPLEGVRGLGYYSMVRRIHAPRA